MALFDDARKIWTEALFRARPEAAVRAALAELPPCGGRMVLVAAGKAAWEMAAAAVNALDGKVDRGVVVTKHGHSRGEIPGVEIWEAGHPVPDENSFRAAQRALDAVRGLTADDRVLLMLSGGGSALFEKPLIPGEELIGLTDCLLRGGADIEEINTVRKRLSAVKGGRFALACRPARVFAVALSDVLSDAPDAIASGPASPDPTTCAQALVIAEKYRLPLSDAARKCLSTETPKALDNARVLVTGSVRILCRTAAETAAALGYRPVLLTSSLACEAREGGRFLAAVAREHSGERVAFIAGGETVVHVSGRGRGGRNQELVLAAAMEMENADGLIFSIGSDGTDGPTDAAGAWADGQTAARIRAQGFDPAQSLADNDAYPALKSAGNLIFTGPTGTNVNDLTVALCGGEE